MTPSSKTGPESNLLLGVTLASAALGGLVGAVTGKPAGPLVGSLLGGLFGVFLAPRDRETYAQIPEIPKTPWILDGPWRPE